MADIIPLNAPRWGASPEDWQHLDLVLGLTEDLLPVVSNPKATIDPASTMKGLGKTPSRYNGQRNAVGIAQWTQHRTSPEEIARWAKEKDYGICIQTRRLRAIDIDVTDPEQAERIRSFIEDRFELPARTRDNSPKLLLAFECAGDLTKRHFKTAHGIVEFLATGQQFIAVGMHPSGSRYQWAQGMPDAFPVLALDDVNALWTDLVAEFALEDSVEMGASVKAEKLANVFSADPTAQYLLDHGHVKRAERDGRLHITCPFEEEHTSDSGETATTYWPAHTGGFINGHFRCLHAHCEHRTDQDFRDAIGYREDHSAEFDAIAAVDRPASEVSDDPRPIPDDGGPHGQGSDAPAVEKPAQRFAVQPAHTFAQAKSTPWMIKGILPQAELAVLFGESGSGKSFLALDMAVAICLGEEWRGMATRKGRVVYVAAEGAGGFRKRLRAIAQQRGLDLADLPIGVISDAPNLMEKGDALDVAKAIVAAGGADLVIMDTFAQVMPGANENSGEDVGRALAHCKGIHRATKALVMLVHHSGKDTSKGARGWSGLRAAADVELEVVRADQARSVTVTKMKDGEDGTEYGFALETVVLGFDADGDEETSCVVEHRDGGSVRRVKRKALGVVQKLVADVHADIASLEDGGVERDALIAAVAGQMPSDPSDTGKRNRSAYQAQRAVDAMVQAGVFEARGLRLFVAEKR